MTTHQKASLPVSYTHLVYVRHLVVADGPADVDSTLAADYDTGAARIKYGTSDQVAVDKNTVAFYFTTVNGEDKYGVAIGYDKMSNVDLSLIHIFGQTHPLQGGLHPVGPLGGGHALVDEGQLHILPGVEGGDEVEALEDEADLLVADVGELPVGQDVYKRQE